MTAYAIFTTLVLGILIGVIGTCLIGDQIDQRTMRRRQELAKKRDDAQMDEAVALVQEELGGTVLSYEKHV